MVWSIALAIMLAGLLQAKRRTILWVATLLAVGIAMGVVATLFWRSPVEIAVSLAAGFGIFWAGKRAQGALRARRA